METYIIGILICISCLGISYYNGYVNKLYNWFIIRQQRAKFLIQLIKNIHNVAETKKSFPSFTVNDSDTSATIIYERMGSHYLLMIPYNRKFVAPMSQFKVELLRHNKEPLNITQQPGIPYMVNAEHLGGFAIKITNEDNGLFHEYPQSILPLYGEEVFDHE